MSDYYAYAPNRELGDRERQLLAHPRVAVVASVSPSGDPHVVPCWFLFEDDRFLMTVHSAARRAPNVQDRGRARVLVEHPLGWISAVGDAQVITGPDIRSLHDRISARYLTDSGRRDFINSGGLPDDAVIQLVPERWMSWDRTGIGARMMDAGHTMEEILGWFEPVASRDP